MSFLIKLSKRYNKKCMKECKKCKQVKFNWQFFKEWFCCPAGCVYNYIDICKKCAKQISYEAVIEENNKVI